MYEYLRFNELKRTNDFKQQKSFLKKKIKIFCEKFRENG